MNGRGTDHRVAAQWPQNGIVIAQMAMPTLALCFGFIFVVATGVFYFAAELSGHGARWAWLLCHQAPALCTNSQPLLYAAGVMFLAYFVMDRLYR